jgi:hypothetical protein
VLNKKGLERRDVKCQVASLVSLLVILVVVEATLTSASFVRKGDHPGASEGEKEREEEVYLQHKIATSSACKASDI